MDTAVFNECRGFDDSVDHAVHWRVLEFMTSAMKRNWMLKLVDRKGKGEL